MSQDERTSQPVSDLGEESAAGTVHDSISGTDAGAVGDFDEDAGKTENTEMEVEKSADVQKSVKLSRGILKSVTKFLSAIRESAAKLSGVMHESAAKLSNAAEYPDEVWNIIQASAQLSSAFLEAKAKTSIDLKKAIGEFFLALYITITEFSSAIQELKQFSSSFQEARADTLSAVQEATAEISSTVQDAATAEFFSTVQEKTVRFLVATFETGTEASHVVHEAADVSSPFQEGTAETSPVVQETGAGNAAAEREEEDGGLSHPPDTGNSTLAIAVPTVESPTECKSSPDSP